MCGPGGCNDDLVGLLTPLPPPTSSLCLEAFPQKQSALHSRSPKAFVLSKEVTGGDSRCEVRGVESKAEPLENQRNSKAKAHCGATTAKRTNCPGLLRTREFPERRAFSAKTRVSEAGRLAAPIQPKTGEDSVGHCLPPGDTVVESASRAERARGVLFCFSWVQVLGVCDSLLEARPEEQGDGSFIFSWHSKGYLLQLVTTWHGKGYRL